MMEDIETSGTTTSTTKNDSVTNGSASTTTSPSNGSTGSDPYNSAIQKDNDLKSTSSSTSTSNNNNNNNFRIQDDNDDDADDDIVLSVHDQLPNVEEYKATTGVTSSSTSTATSTKRCCGCNRTCQYILGCCFILLIILISIIVGIILGEEDAAFMFEDTVEYVDSNGKVQYRDSRYESFMEFVGLNRWTDLNLVVGGQKSYVQHAIRYIADEDKLYLSFTDPQMKDRFAIVLLYYSLGGVYWKKVENDVGTNYIYDHMFNKNTSVCEWNDSMGNAGVKVGIFCNAEQRVDKIILPSHGAQGLIPDEIQLLTEITFLNLYNNKLTGNVPTALGTLSNLQTLLLHRNSFIGQISEDGNWFTSLSNLETLNLGYNGIEGTIPTIMNELVNLKDLNMNSNFLRGEDNLINLMSLSKLESLQLEDNEMADQLTSEFLSALPNLKTLYLGNNALQGTLPTNIFERPQLEVLDLQNNLFTGGLPNDLNVNEKLKVLALNGNQINGTMNIIYRLETLEHLDLTGNKFTGEIATSIGKLTKLRYLYLGFNEYLSAGSIPTEIGLMVNLRYLSLQDTKRINMIPTQIGSLNKLVILDLAMNELEGEIPSQLGNENLGENLQYLYLHNNPELTGTIPIAISQLTMLQSFVTFNTDLTSVSTVNDTSPLDILCELGGREQFQMDCSKITCTCCQYCGTTSCPDFIPPTTNTNSCSDFYFYTDLDPIDQYFFNAGKDYNFYDVTLNTPIEVEVADNSNLYDTLAEQEEEDEEDLTDDFADVNELFDLIGVPLADAYNDVPPENPFSEPSDSMSFFPDEGYSTGGGTADTGSGTGDADV